MDGTIFFHWVKGGPDFFSHRQREPKFFWCKRFMIDHYKKPVKMIAPFFNNILGVNLS